MSPLGGLTCGRVARARAGRRRRGACTRVTEGPRARFDRLQRRDVCRDEGKHCVYFITTRVQSNDIPLCNIELLLLLLMLF